MILSAGMAGKVLRLGASICTPAQTTTPATLSVEHNRRKYPSHSKKMTPFDDPDPIYIHLETRRGDRRSVSTRPTRPIRSPENTIYNHAESCTGERPAAPAVSVYAPHAPSASQKESSYGASKSPPIAMGGDLEGGENLHALYAPDATLDG